MGDPRDVLIGIEAGDGSVGAAAFDLRGHQLGAARRAVPVERLADGGVEQDPGATWQAVVRALRDLAMRVPDMAHRTVGLAITGDGDGTWLIDEDGDPVGPALSACDRRAVPLVRSWRRSEVGPAVESITGCTLAPPVRSAQLSWLQAHRPDALARAVRALSIKDWLYFCGTGEPVAGPEQAAAFGELRTARHDPRVLELLGLEDVARLLPELVDDPYHHDPLGEAAGAATGLTPGTPVFLGPDRVVATAVAAGLVDPGALGGSILGPSDAHLRVVADPAGLAAPTGEAERFLAVPSGDLRYAVVRPAGGWRSVDWLVDFASRLLADAGLIGIGRDEVFAALERGAAEAAPLALALHGFGTPAGGRTLGLGEETTPYDLVRAAFEALAFGARAAHATLGHRPGEIRLIGAPSGLARRILAAATGAVVRPLDRAEPAATGAALLATVGLGESASPAEAAHDWVTPYLGPTVAVDPTLHTAYTAAFETWRSGETSTRWD